MPNTNESLNKAIEALKGVIKPEEKKAETPEEKKKREEEEKKGKSQ